MATQKSLRNENAGEYIMDFKTGKFTITINNKYKKDNSVYDAAALRRNLATAISTIEENTAMIDLTSIHIDTERRLSGDILFTLSVQALRIIEHDEVENDDEDEEEDYEAE